MTQETELHPNDVEPITLADHGYFFVGGKYVDSDGSVVMTGGIYVEKFVPADQRQPYPVVMLHGGGAVGCATVPKRIGLPANIVKWC